MRPLTGWENWPMPDTYSSLLYHVVFSTKYRAPRLDADLRSQVFEYIGGVVRRQQGVLLEIGGVEDHVHLLVQYRPTVAIADGVRVIKSNSSKWLNEEVVDELFRWQAGYGAFTVGRSMVPSVRRYIRDQERHHQKRSFKDEFLELLVLNDVEFDEETVWD